MNKIYFELANLIKLNITCDEEWIPLMKKYDQRYIFYIRGWELIFEYDDHIRIGDINANYIKIYDDHLDVNVVSEEYKGIIEEAVYDAITDLGMVIDVNWM